MAAISHQPLHLRRVSYKPSHYLFHYGHRSLEMVINLFPPCPLKELSTQAQKKTISSLFRTHFTRPAKRPSRLQIPPSASVSHEIPPQQDQSNKTKQIKPTQCQCQCQCQCKPVDPIPLSSPRCSTAPPHQCYASKKAQNAPGAA